MLQNINFQLMHGKHEAGCKAGGDGTEIHFLLHGARSITTPPRKGW